MTRQLSSELRQITEYNLSSQVDYSRLHSRLADAVEQFDGANNAFAALGRAGLMGIFTETSPSTLNLLEDVRHVLKEGSGVAVVHGTGVDRVDDETAQLVSIALSSVYGRPTKTDKKLPQVAWP